ncbi:MAG: transglycosylase domain-containing protein, partial [Proteobacteria bacterium]|nr:transglycosylase domain-containing protein [Pseudomonadota bacterium]
MNKRKSWIAGLILLPGIAFVVLNLIFPLPKERLAPPASVMVLDKSGRLLRPFTSKDGKWRMRAKLNEVSPFLKKAVLAYEDKWFYRHPGVNPISLLRAAITNCRASQVVCGGSTITMQVARMMEPRPRTYKAKLVEIFRSLQLELTLSKDEILELYLNLAPYGGNIEGVAAASYLYFGKDPCSLSVGEAALLCALPKSPTRLRPDQSPKKANEAKEQVLGRLKKCGLITEAKQKEAIGSKIPERRQGLPFIAPHLSSVLAAKYSKMPRIKSTIDFSIQSLCQGFLKKHLSSLKKAGITNGACVVIENKTGAVRA